MGSESPRSPRGRMVDVDESARDDEDYQAEHSGDPAPIVKGSGGRRGRSLSRSPTPEKERKRSYTPPEKMRERSYTPPEKMRERSYTPPEKMRKRSYTPPEKMRERSYTPPQKMRERSLSPPEKRRERSLTPPERRRERSLSQARSPTPPKQRERSRSRSPRSPVRRRSYSPRRKSYSPRRRERSRERERRRSRSPPRRYTSSRRDPSPRRRSPRRGRSPLRNRYNGIGKPGNNLFIAGFNFITNEKDLEKKFSKYGHVVDARIVRDARNGESRGFGFVTLDRDEDADDAIRALDQTEWSGRIILVEKAKTPIR